MIITRSNNKKNNTSLNVTPIIDIVFLLIIFFLLVCQFVEVENFPACVPDSCGFASEQTSADKNAIVLTVTKTNKGKAEFAIGTGKISSANKKELVANIAEVLDIRFEAIPARQRIVTLRSDKDICFEDVQYALAAIAQSSAANIQLAAFKEKQTAP